MSWKSIDESPAVSRPVARASTWLAELVVVAAVALVLLNAGKKESATSFPPVVEEEKAPAPLLPPAEEKSVGRVSSVTAPPPVVETPAPEKAPGIAPPPPPPAPPPVPAAERTPGSLSPDPFAGTYRREWRAAAARAAQRDLDGAVSLLRRAGRDSEESRREAAADLADIHRLRALEERAAGRLAALPRGSQVELDVRGRGRVAGELLAADCERVELATADGPAFVEFVDLSWATLAGWGDEDARAVALALRLAGRPAEGLDEKHAALTAPDVPSPLEDGERRARALLYEAERAFRRPATRAKAVARYRQLLADFPAEAVVRRSLPRIHARSKLPEELYYMAADLRGAGAFRLAAGAWRTEGAVELPRARQSFVEADFEAEPGATLRAFVRLGGCCERSLHAYAQASGLQKAQGSRGVKVAVEPGSIYALILRPPAGAVPAKHVDGHAVAWTWIEIPLPAYATPGPKQIRILTDREGLHVGGLLLSTTRSGPPGEADVRALEAARDVE